MVFKICFILVYYFEKILKQALERTSLAGTSNVKTLVNIYFLICLQLCITFYLTQIRSLPKCLLHPFPRVIAGKLLLFHVLGPQILPDI